jgi:hypothetical protein
MRVAEATRSSRCWSAGCDVGVGVAGHIDEFRIARVQRSDGWIETTWNNMSDPGSFAVADRGAGRRRAAAPIGRRCGRLPDRVSANGQESVLAGTVLRSQALGNARHRLSFGARRLQWRCYSRGGVPAGASGTSSPARMSRRPREGSASRYGSPTISIPTGRPSLVYPAGTLLPDGVACRNRRWSSDVQGHMAANFRVSR